MRAAFWSAIPPERMALATSSLGASSTSSQEGKRRFRVAKARPEFTSEVCCDSTVATSSSITGMLGFALNGPCRRRSRRCTARMRRTPGGPSAAVALTRATTLSISSSVTGPTVTLHCVA